MDNDATSSHPRRSSVPVLVLLVLLCAAGAAVAWYVLPHGAGTGANAGIDAAAGDALLKTSGLEHPVVNKLDARYADADGDLVADAPKSDKDFVDPPKLMFCYVTGSSDAAPYKQAWSDLMKHISEATGKPVEYADVDSDQEDLKALRAMREGKLHIAGFNTGRVAIAVDACGFVPVAMLGGNGASSKTHTEVIVPADSSIQTLADLKGHVLALTDPESNSGYKAPVVFLADHGLRYGKDYEPRYTGGHDASIAGIAAHRYDAAAVAADLLQRAVTTGTIKKEQYRSIFQSEPFPTAGLGYAYNLKPELAKKIRDAMLSYPWKGTTMEKFFTESGQSGLAQLSYKDDFSIVRRVDNAIGFEHVIK